MDCTYKTIRGYSIIIIIVFSLYYSPSSYHPSARGKKVVALLNSILFSSPKYIYYLALPFYSTYLIPFLNRNVFWHKVCCAGIGLMNRREFLLSLVYFFFFFLLMKYSWVNQRCGREKPLEAVRDAINNGVCLFAHFFKYGGAFSFTCKWEIKNIKAALDIHQHDFLFFYYYTRSVRLGNWAVVYGSDGDCMCQKRQWISN